MGDKRLALLAIKRWLAEAGPVVTLATRSDALLAALIFSGAIASRLPFRSQFLYHWDSVSYALAIERFDLSARQLPGYPLYVVLGRLVNALVANPPDSLVFISVIASGASAVALYRLGTVLFHRPVGILAALFLITSPLFWFYGEVALPHMLDTFFVVTVVYLLCRGRSGGHPHFYLASAVLAVAGGFRPQTLAFLLPLWAYVAMRIDWARRIKAVVLLIGLCSAWIVPLLWVIGGPARYVELTGSFMAMFRYFEAATLLAQGNGEGLIDNLGKLIRYTAYAWGLTALPLAFYVCRAPRQALASFRSSKAALLLIWITPSLAFYVFVHMGQQGLVFVFLPALLLISAVAAVRLAGPTFSGPFPPAAWLALVLAVNSAIFLFAPQNVGPADRLKLLSRDTINAADAYYAAAVDTIRGRFPATKTVLVGANWRQMAYYLPDYPLIKLPPRNDPEANPGIPVMEGELTLDGLSTGPSGLTVVFFNRGLRFVTTSMGQAEAIPLASGDTIWYVNVDGTGRLRWTASRAAWGAPP